MPAPTQTDKKEASAPLATAVSLPVEFGSSPQSIQVEIALLRERLESLSRITDIVFLVIGGLVVLGTVTSLFSWTRHEWGEVPRAEKRANELHELAVRGESAAQQRADEIHRNFLSASKDTLDLVNATLTLAKDASERAARAVEIRAKSMMLELDRASKDLLATAGQDDRALVTDPAKTATLRSLAQRIEGFQITRLVLPDEIQLSGECLFVRGMDFHLKQQYDDAFEAWTSVTHMDNVKDALCSRAWYWIGYEHNNLGNFPRACTSFQSALETATGVRKYELQRLLIESKFFNREKEADLLAALQALHESTLQNADDGIEPVRKRIVSTMGNICLEMAHTLRKEGRGDEASVQYENARKFFTQANGHDKWALFGLAEALYGLGSNESLRIFKDDVRPKAIDEEIRRIEPRTKVLAKTTELICCIRVPDLWSEVPAIYSQVTEALGRVEGRLTVYSQSQRRNVSKENFRKDLFALMDEFKKDQAANGTRAA